MGQHFYSGGTLQWSQRPQSAFWDTNAIQSVYTYLSGTFFQRELGGASGTMRTWHPLLTMGAAYPKNLGKITLPHAALDSINASPDTDLMFGSGARQRERQFVLWGFAGSFQNPDKNDWERDLLMGDLRSLLVDAQIPIYNFSSGVTVTQVGVGQTEVLTAETLPPGSPSTVEEHKFQITFRLEY